MSSLPESSPFSEVLRSQKTMVYYRLKPTPSDSSRRELAFCERHEFNIRFACMVVFALMLIVGGSCISQAVREGG